MNAGIPATIAPSDHHLTFCVVSYFDNRVTNVRHLIRGSSPDKRPDHAENHFR